MSLVDELGLKNSQKDKRKLQNRKRKENTGQGSKGLDHSYYMYIYTLYSTVMCIVQYCDVHCTRLYIPLTGVIVSSVCKLHGTNYNNYEDNVHVLLHILCFVNLMFYLYSGTSLFQTPLGLYKVS